jgi:predicted ester cyclase
MANSLPPSLLQGQRNHDLIAIGSGGGQERSRSGSMSVSTHTLRGVPRRPRFEDQIAEGDKVVTRMTSYGKHEADLPGAPRTGNDLKMSSITIHRIANGKLVEKWARC